MNVEDGFEATLRGQQKRRILVAVAGGTAVLVLVSVGLLVNALGRSSEAPAVPDDADHRAMLKASIRAQRSALSQRQAVPVLAAKAPKAEPAEKPAPIAKAKAAPVKARKSSGKHAAPDEDGLKRPSIADPVAPPPPKTVASSAGGTRGDEPADPN